MNLIEWVKSKLAEKPINVPSYYDLTLETRSTSSLPECYSADCDNPSTSLVEVWTNREPVYLCEYHAAHLDRVHKPKAKPEFQPYKVVEVDNFSEPTITTEVTTGDGEKEKG